MIGLGIKADIHILLVEVTKKKKKTKSRNDQTNEKPHCFFSLHGEMSLSITWGEKKKRINRNPNQLIEHGKMFSYYLVFLHFFSFFLFSQTDKLTPIFFHSFEVRRSRYCFRKKITIFGWKQTS